MFYSQTFLARKGPLGTVWCAAHLQHKLRKSHYTATDIPDIVERIMFPEVPIALRMSSHLLLGVVRIYSKKVDYLYQDCNLVLVTLKNAFVYTDVNLPPNATQAQFNAVTLPETYQLDALDIDDVWPSEPYQENHVHRQEDITLEDDIENPNLGGYLAITFDDDIMEHTSNPEPPNEDLPILDEGSGEVPTNGGEGDHDQEPIPAHTSPNHPVADDDAAVPNTNDMNEPDNVFNMDVTPQDMDEIEVMRDAVAVADPNPLPMPELLDQQDIGVTSPIEHSGTIVRDKETPVISEENVHGQDPSPLSNAFPTPPGGTPDPFQLNPSPGNNSPALELQPTPQAERPQVRRKRQITPQARKKRRVQVDDEKTVLSNEFMKSGIKVCTDLVRKRKHCPSKNVDAWRVNNRLKKEHIFFEPSVSGLCSDLGNLFERGFISSKPNLVLSDNSEESHQDTTRSEQPSSPVELLQEEPHEHVSEPLPDPVEHLRDEPHEHVNEPLPDPVENLRDEPHHHEPSIIADLMPSSPHIASPRAATPPSHNLNSPFSAGTGFQSMQALGSSISTGGGSKQATPVRDLEIDNYSSAGRSYSPTFMNSADDELAFLEMDSHSPTDSQGTQGNDTLSARTRAVAQYLMGQSPSSSSPAVHHGSRTLTLKTLLHGRSRKMCARMLYETLVLSSYGLIKVEQEEPNEQDEVYGDIKLSLTSKASKGQF